MASIALQLLEIAKSRGENALGAREPSFSCSVVSQKKSDAKSDEPKDFLRATRFRGDAKERRIVMRRYTPEELVALPRLNADEARVLGVELLAVANRQELPAWV